jgi:hypothetical protein
MRGVHRDSACSGGPGLCEATDSLRCAAAVGELVGDGVAVGVTVATAVRVAVIVGDGGGVAVLVGVEMVVAAGRDVGADAGMSGREASVEVGRSKTCGRGLCVCGGELIFAW